MRANERTDVRVAQYLHLASWLLATGYSLSTDSAQQEDHLTNAISSHRPKVTFPKKLTLLQNVMRSGLIGDRQFDRMSNVFDNRRIMVLLCHHVDE